MKKKKLVFLDIDGTMLPHEDKRFTTELKEAIKQLKLNGHEPWLCTGRTKLSAQFAIDELGIENIISSNGQHIMQDGLEVYKRFFTKGEITTMHDLLTELELVTCINNDHGSYIEEQFKDKSHLLEKTLNAYGFFNVRCVEELKFAGALQIFTLGTTAQLDALEERLPSRFCLLRWSDGVGEITFKHTHKGSAIKKVINDRHETYAFGDNLNDYEMFLTCDYGIAMGNAHEKLKQKATFVSTPCNDFGVVNGLKHYKLIK